MSKIQSKGFVHQYLIHNCRPEMTIREVECMISFAINLHKIVDEKLAVGMSKRKVPEGELYTTAKGKIIEGDPLTWFEAIWSAWNEGIETGSLGGKKAAGDAFISQKIDSREKAERAWKAVMRYAEYERPKVIADKNKTAPYFNKWFNDGRWDTQVITKNVFAQAEAKGDLADKERKILIAEINEQKASIKQFTTLGQMQLIEPAKKRLGELEGKLQQLERNKNAACNNQNECG